MPDKNGFLTWADFAGTAQDYEGVRIRVTDVDKVYVSINGQWKQIKSLDEMPRRLDKVLTAKVEGTWLDEKGKGQK